MLPYAVADLLGVFFEVTLFGAYTVIFSICLWVIYNKRTINFLLSSAAICGYVLAAIYIALDLRRVSGSYELVPGTYGAGLTYTANHIDVLDYVTNYTFVVNSLIADSVLIWRCFAVWGRDVRIILVPMLMWVGTAIGGFGSSYYLSHSPPSGIVGPVAQDWGKTATALSLSTNVLTTTLIAARIWWQRRAVQSAFGDRARHTKYYNWVIAIVIESGSIYSSMLICELILYTRNDTSTLVMGSILSQVSGIVPTLIIVYAALGNTIDSTPWSPSRSDPDQPVSRSTNFLASAFETASRHQQQSQQQFSRQILHVHSQGLGMLSPPKDEKGGQQPSQHTIEIGACIEQLDQWTTDHEHHVPVGFEAMDSSEKSSPNRADIDIEALGGDMLKGYQSSDVLKSRDSVKHTSGGVEVNQGWENEATR